MWLYVPENPPLPRPEQHLYISLATGGGGLDLGIDAGSSGATRAVCLVENEATAAALLVHRMETAHLPAAPLWSDLRTFDFGAWRGLVDGLVGGYPCQPFSYAGARRGEDDPRHLWPAIAAGIRELEPRWCFFENVGGHLSLGFREVARDLQGMGYTVAAALVTAEEVGAPHRRERLFILAVADSALLGQREPHDQARPVSRGDAREGARGGGDRSDAELADANLGSGGTEPRLQHQARAEVSTGAGTVGDADGARPQGWRESLGERADQWSAWPPGPTDADAWGRVLAVRPDLAPAVEPDVRGGADGTSPRLDLARSDRLRILGNGVVPQQAAYAWRLLWAGMRAR